MARAEPGHVLRRAPAAVRCPRRWPGATTSRAAGSPATSSSAASTIAFDGFGQRDHSWGFRHWAGLHQWHWVTGFLGDGRCFNLFEVHTHDGTTTVNGFVHGPDGDDYVTAADRVPRAGRRRRRGELSADAHHGRRRARSPITGERGRLSVPVRPAPDQPAVVHETPVRLDADGVAGYGIYEHLVTEFD